MSWGICHRPQSVLLYWERAPSDVIGAPHGFILETSAFAGETLLIINVVSWKKEFFEASFYRSLSWVTWGNVAWSFWHGIDLSSVTNSNCPRFWFNQLEARYQLSGSDEYVIGCVSIQFESDGSTPIWILSDKIISPLLGRFRTPTVNDSLIITETGWFAEKLTVWAWHGLVLLLLHLRLLSKLASFVQIHEFALLGFRVKF